jgi:hypothetical protein
MAVPDRPDPDELIDAEWGRWVQDQVATPHGAAAHRTTPFTAPASTIVAIQYDVVDRDVAGCRTSASLYTAKAAGWYHVTAGGYYDSNSSGTRRHMAFRLNGSTAGMPQVEMTPPGAEVAILSLAGDVKLALNDTIDVVLYQNTAISLGFQWARFTMRLVIPL